MTNPSSPRTPKVYTMNLSGHNYEDAKQYGELVHLTKGTVDGKSANKYFREILFSLQDLQPGDFIICTSLQVINWIAGYIMGWKGVSPLNLLYYTKGKYQVISLDFQTLLEEEETNN